MLIPAVGTVRGCIAATGRRPTPTARLTGVRLHDDLRDKNNKKLRGFWHSPLSFSVLNDTLCKIGSTILTKNHVTT